MTRCESLAGPIFFAHAVLVDGVVQVAVIQPNIALATFDRNAGWPAVNIGLEGARKANRYAMRRVNHALLGG